MWIEDQGGITSSQFVRYKYDFSEDDNTTIPLRVSKFYSFITYRTKEGADKQALFIFVDQEAHRNFVRAFIRWKKQDGLLIPNYQ